MQGCGIVVRSAMIKYTLTDITSHSKGNLYIPKGVQVAIHHTSGHVIFIEYNGQVYPCTAERLSDTPVMPDKPKQKLSAKDEQLIEDYLKAKR